MGKKRIEPDKVALILDMLKTDPHRALNSIANSAGVDSKTVKKLKVEHDEELNGHFFSERLKSVSHDELMRICQDRSYDPAPDTTKVRDDTDIREISKPLLDMHRVQAYSPAAKKSLVAQYKAGSKNFHGFWIYSRHESFDADAAKTLTDFVGQLEDDPPVMDLFTSIFEFSQKLSHTTASRNAMLNAGTTDPPPQPPSRVGLQGAGCGIVEGAQCGGGAAERRGERGSGADSDSAAADSVPAAAATAARSRC
jgi:hypothetical protein